MTDGMGVGRRVGMVLAVVLAPLAAAGGAGASAPHDQHQRQAQVESEPPIGLGSCGPFVSPTSSLVTCRFPLAAAEGGPHLVDSLVSARIAGPNPALSAPCHVDDATTELVCPDLLTPAVGGDYQVDLPALGLEAVAEMSVALKADPVWVLVRKANRLDTVPVNSMVSIQAIGAAGREIEQRLDAVLVRPDTTAVRATSRAIEPGDGEGEVNVIVPEPGRWHLIGCVVPTGHDQITDLGQCGATSTPLAVNAIEIDAEPLIPDHNRTDADRIQVVFVGTGMNDADQLAAAASTLLSLDGRPVTRNERGVTVPYEAGRSDGLGWGLFAIEPFLTSADRFNFWYVRQANVGSPMSPGSMDIDLRFDVEALGLGPHVAIVNLSRWGEIDGQRPQADLPNFALAPGDELPAGADVRLGRVYLPLAGDPLPGDATILARELAHALFGLRSEYLDPGSRTATVGPPNCAASEADAERLWGHLMGRLDPMYHRWRETETAAGRWYDGPETAPETFTVGYVPGGCFAAESGQSIRPTGDSLMNSGSAVLGAVNRERVEQVLALWPDPGAPVAEQPTTSVLSDVPQESSPATSGEPVASADAGAEGRRNPRPVGVPVAVMGGLGTVGVVGAALASYRAVARRRELAEQ